MSRELDIREPPRRSTTSSNPSPPLRNCVVGKRRSQATRGWRPRSSWFTRSRTLFALREQGAPGACTGPWPSAKIRWQHSNLRNEADSAWTPERDPTAAQPAVTLGKPLRLRDPRSSRAREYPAPPSLRSQPVGRSLSILHKRARSDAKSVTNSACLSRVLSLDAPGFFLRWTQRAC
jgi:hypothetical protein